MKYFTKPLHINRVTLILLLLGIGIGLLITAQWKTKTARVSNPVVPYVALEETRTNLIREQTELKKQIEELQNTINADEAQLKTQTMNRGQIEELEKYKEPAGLTEIKGRGVKITIDDSKKSSEVNAITHAADLRDLVNFLWSIKAKAISINDERVVFTTSIDCLVNTILINNTKQVPPFTIKAVGDSPKLMEGLADKNNLKDIYRRAEDEGLVFYFSQENDLTIKPSSESLAIEYAKIVK